MYFLGQAFPPVFSISKMSLSCGTDPLHHYDLSSCRHLTSSSEGRHIAAAVSPRPLCALPVLVDLFTKFRITIISNVMSARLSASWNISVPTGQIFFTINDGSFY